MKTFVARFLECSLAAILALAPWESASAQVTSPRDQGVFRSVPQPARRQLINRLNLLVSYQVAANWKREYELLSVVVKNGETKAEYVDRLRRSTARGIVTRISSFKPLSLVYKGGGPADAVIFGCARLGERSRKYVYASISAYREKRNWHFSEIGIISQVDQGPQPCQVRNHVRSATGRLGKTGIRHCDFDELPPKGGFFLPRKRLPVQ